MGLFSFCFLSSLQTDHIIFYVFISLRCKAVNSLLKMEFLSSGGYLTVVSRASEEGTSFQHSLLAVPSKVEVQEGEKAVLECITDDEEPLLEWSRIGMLSLSVFKFSFTLHYKNTTKDNTAKWIKRLLRFHPHKAAKRDFHIAYSMQFWKCLDASFFEGVKVIGWRKT